SGLARWRCKACLHSFSITSGTLFHSRKMPLRGYLLAIAIFCNEVKGKSMLAMSRDLGTGLSDQFRAGAQDERGDGVRTAGHQRWRRGAQGGNRWRLLRRLRQAGQPHREPPRSEAKTVP